MADRHAVYEHSKEAFEQVEATFKLVEVFNSVIEILHAMHRIIARALESLVHVAPPIGLIFTGAATLAALIRPKHNKTTHRVSQGVKLVSGLGMVAAAVVGLVIPPLGVGMLMTGLGLGLGRTLYKLWRTSFKLAQAEQAQLESAQKQGEKKVDTTNTTLIEKLVYKHRYKLQQRKINTFVAVATMALIAVAVVAPPAAIVCFSFLAGLNTTYSLYRVRKPVARFFSSIARGIRRILGLSQPASKQEAASVISQPTMAPRPKPTVVVKAALTLSEKETDTDDDREREGGRGQRPSVAIAAVTEAVLQTQISDENRPHPEHHGADSGAQQTQTVAPDSDGLVQEEASVTKEAAVKSQQQAAMQQTLQQDSAVLAEISHRHEHSFAERHPEVLTASIDQQAHPTPAAPSSSTAKATADFLAREQRALYPHPKAHADDSLKKASIARLETIKEEEEEEEESEGGGGDSEEEVLCRETMH